MPALYNSRRGFIPYRKKASASRGVRKRSYGRAVGYVPRSAPRISYKRYKSVRSFTKPLAGMRMYAVKGKASNTSITRRSSGDYSVIIQSRVEYCRDVLGTTAFSVGTNAVNAGNSALFPWLAGQAKGFEFYRFHKLQFMYLTNSGEATSAASPTIGKVLMCMDYDGAATQGFGNKQQMEDYQGCTAGPIYHDRLTHYVNCDTNCVKNLPVKNFYISDPTGTPVTAHDPNLVNFGILNVASFGIPSAAVGAAIGELWCKYTVELIKPRIGAVQQTQRFTNVNLDSSTTQPLGAEGSVKRTKYEESEQKYVPPVIPMEVGDAPDIVQIEGGNVSTPGNSRINFPPGHYFLNYDWDTNPEPGLPLGPDQCYPDAGIISLYTDNDGTSTQASSLGSDGSSTGGWDMQVSKEIVVPEGYTQPVTAQNPNGWLGLGFAGLGNWLNGSYFDLVVDVLPDLPQLLISALLSSNKGTINDPAGPVSEFNSELTNPNSIHYVAQSPILFGNHPVLGYSQFINVVSTASATNRMGTHAWATSGQPAATTSGTTLAYWNSANSFGFLNAGTYQLYMKWYGGGASITSYPVFTPRGNGTITYGNDPAAAAFLTQYALITIPKGGDIFDVTGLAGATGSNILIMISSVNAVFGYGQ